MYIPDTAYSNAVLYGETSPRLREYLRETTERMYHSARERGSEFMSNIMERFDHYHSSSALRRERAVRSRVNDAYYTRDIVRELFTLSEIQHAPDTMKYYIGADPVVKQRIEAQTTEAWGDDYVQTAPGMMGRLDYYYRRMTDGLVDITETGYSVEEYREILRDDDRRLDPDEIGSIKRTVDRVRYYFAKGEEDPLSRTGNWL